MRCWNRIIAIVVALVFASSSSLAAMPLVWCLGADGHRAVEYKIGNTHADHQALGRRGPAATDNSEPRAADHDDCMDWTLVGKAKVSALQADHGLLTFGLRVAVVLPAVRMPTLPEVAEATRWQPPERAPPDPQRTALRSVVLRI